jgi:hypothetical protein
MYAYTHDPITLDDGSIADKGLVVGQFGDGNTQNRPLGSGFWAYATTRDTTSYRETEGTLYGLPLRQERRRNRVRTRTWSRANNDFKLSTMVK